jgi:hypothetical protein
VTIKTDIDLKAAFKGRETNPATGAGDIPERIKNHAPAPALRPGGGWKARADAIDRRVREGQDAAKARREWAGRIRARHKPGMRMSFTRSSGGE